MGRKWKKFCGNYFLSGSRPGRGDWWARWEWEAKTVCSAKCHASGLVTKTGVAKKKFAKARSSHGKHGLMAKMDDRRPRPWSLVLSTFHFWDRSQWKNVDNALISSNGCSSFDLRLSRHLKHGAVIDWGLRRPSVILSLLLKTRTRVININGQYITQCSPDQLKTCLNYYPIHPFSS